MIDRPPSTLPGRASIVARPAYNLAGPTAPGSRPAFTVSASAFMVGPPTFMSPAAMVMDDRDAGTVVACELVVAGSSYERGPRGFLLVGFAFGDPPPPFIVESAAFTIVDFGVVPAGWSFTLGRCALVLARPEAVGIRRSFVLGRLSCTWLAVPFKDGRGTCRVSGAPAADTPGRYMRRLGALEGAPQAARSPSPTIPVDSSGATVN